MVGPLPLKSSLARVALIYILISPMYFLFDTKKDQKESEPHTPPSSPQPNITHKINHYNLSINFAFAYPPHPISYPTHPPPIENNNNNNNNNNNKKKEIIKQDRVGAPQNPPIIAYACLCTCGVFLEAFVVLMQLPNAC